MRAHFPIVFVLSSFSAACSPGTAGSVVFGDPDAGDGRDASTSVEPVPDAAPPDATRADTDAAATPQGICGQYLACVAATTPAGLGAVTAVYGKGGSCWTQLDERSCEAACKTGIVQTHASFPEEETCNVCDAPADCPSKLPACNVETHKCIECAAQGDCRGDVRKACNTSSNRCVQCVSDGDCPPQGPRPFCDTSTNTCVACAKNDDCAAMYAPPICDPSTKTCRSCAADAECASHVCESGACVECRTDAQCPAEAPKCDASHRCIACSDGSTCASGACNTMTGKCCDPNTCKNEHVECGYAFDLAGCGIFPVPCGACPPAQNCVRSTCKDAPANHCGAGCAGRCGFVPESNSYECVASTSSCENSTNTCSSGFMCESAKNQTTGETYHYCGRYCLVDADCGAAGKCTSLYGVKGLGTCE